MSRIVPRSQTGHVRKRISKPWSTIKRELEALHMLGMLRCDEEETTTTTFQEKTIFRYSLQTILTEPHCWPWWAHTITRYVSRGRCGRI